MTPLLLLAESTRTDLRWHRMPPAWVVVLVLVPAVIAAAWWAYRREAEVPRGPRILLTTLRAMALALFLIVLFGPFAEVSEMRKVPRSLVVLLDQSQSMSTVDSYGPEDSRALAAAAGIPLEQVSGLQRAELARRVLVNAQSGLLEDWTRDFRVHVFGFGSQVTPLASDAEQEGETSALAEETPASGLRRRLAQLQATDPATRIGQAVATVLDTFRLRDELLAGVVVVTDGQENGTVILPVQAGRKAAAAKVPVFAVGVGDPRETRNIHVSNVRAKEVVLARDDTAFEFSVHAKGFEGRRAKIELFQRTREGQYRRLDASPPEVVLEGNDRDQEVRITHRFETAGLLTVRIGIPVQPEEKIQSDNYVEHTIRVIDRKIRVLYVESSPRWECLYLANALIRDRDTMLTHTLLLDADPDTPQRRTLAQDWPALDASLGLPKREKLFDYDVVILGDVDWKSLADSDDARREALQNLRDFVDKGGGMLFLSGAMSNPRQYKDTELQPLLPVVVDRTAENSDPEIDTTEGFPLRLTPEGESSPLMNVAGDVKASKTLWQEDDRFRQYWCYPVLRAKTLAKVLAVSGHPAHLDPRLGARPVIATMLYGRGRVLWLGIDELWRMRKDAADRYFYRFYGEAVRFLATYKLLGGNRRFKILTDRDQYGVDEPVRVTLEVLDRDYEPSKAPAQTITVRIPGPPGGEPETVEVPVPMDPTDPRTYRKTILPTRPGEYRIEAATDDPQEEAPGKIFRVVESTVEGRDLVLDPVRIREMAEVSEGGRYLALSELPSLHPDPQATLRLEDKHEEESWDDAWTLAAATALLAAEWLLRKRWHLV